MIGASYEYQIGLVNNCNGIKLVNGRMFPNMAIPLDSIICESKHNIYLSTNSQYKRDNIPWELNNITQYENHQTRS